MKKTSTFQNGLIWFGAGVSIAEILTGTYFAPMIAVQLADNFILKRSSFGLAFDWVNLAVWLAGFALYRWLMTVDIPVGSTLPDMLLTMALCAAVRKLLPKRPAHD